MEDPKLISDPSLRVLYLSHGGGPMPLLGDEGHREMVGTLKQIASDMTRPSAILIVSAHWEETRPTVTTGAHPPLIYDYYGFPPPSYSIQYPAPGDPLLAEQVVSILKKEGIDTAADDQRGFDHGVFVPLKIMYPGADIPCVQISLINNLDPDDHIRIGNAISELKRDGLLLIGSGMSFHNMRAFSVALSGERQSMNESFEDWLTDTCSKGNIDEAERSERLKNWERVSSARFCHPREEHLIPLHVCYGAAKRACPNVFRISIMGVNTSMYLW